MASRRPRGPAHTLDEVLRAVKGSRGIRSFIADRLHCSRQTVLNYEKRWKSVADAIAEERANIVDYAESKLFEALTTGSWQAIKYVLSTLGRDRGYDPEIDPELFQTTAPDGSIMLIDGPKDQFIAGTQGLAEEGERMAGRGAGYTPDPSMFDAFQAPPLTRPEDMAITMPDTTTDEEDEDE